MEWLFKQDFDMDGPMAYPAFVKQMVALVMGRSTYEWLLAHQDAWEYTQPTFVFTHRELPIPDGADVRLVSDGVADAFPEIAESAAGADVWVVGGGDLAGQFADAVPLDEVWVQYAPLTLGEGRPLLTLRLQSEPIDTARNREFVCARYSVGATISWE